MFLDGLKNIVANLNTSRDKASHSTYEEVTVDDEQLVAMYRTSAIAKKIVDLPAEDSLREWREWYATKEQISLLEGEEKRLGKQAAYTKASKRARLFGGAAIFIGTGDNDLEKPLDPERIAKGGIKYLTVLSRHSLMAGLLGTDPREPTYGKPIDYQMSTEFAILTIHPSRLVIFHGSELPDERYSGSRLGWSDPVLQSVLTSVRNLDATVANVASLVFEAKVDVVGINGFNEGLRSGGHAYEQLVLTRAALTAQGKGVNGTMVMDALDTYTQKSASFATLPDIMDRFMQLTSAASSIPMTLLFGMSAGGLNATGESDTRGYYDRVKVLQTLQITPASNILDECLIHSALGSRPPEVHYNWRPLWQPTTKERAETGKLVADTFKIVSDLEVLDPEVIAEALVNGLTENGLATGLESGVVESDNDVPDGDQG